MKEPAWSFIDELQKPLHNCKPAFWSQRPSQENELSLSGGISVQMEFPDPDGVLQTALTDFARFCIVMDLAESGESDVGVQLEIKSAETDCFEAFRFTVAPTGLTLEAADPEGIRRGLVHLEDRILAAGAPVLPYGSTEQKPHIRTRLSRCFFGPIKRPPMNRDELEDQINYYPDEYLNRLAHEGVNALWLTITFRDTIPITILPGFGRRADIHIPKLQETVARCARYGIRIFVFFIEPTAFTDERDNPRYLDIRLYEQDYPELIGNRQGQQAGFCPSSDLARTFLYEATHTLFQRVPGLGGMIDISVGERFTHCCSWWSGQNNCPRCGVKKPYQVLADVLTCLHKGMQDANPKAEFISWPYSQYLLWGDEGTIDAAGLVPDNVILQHNFESAGQVEQLGRMRRADDYWLSYTGPSDLYRRCALRARQNHTRMFAKLQVGCSHEVASVTHVPVPGILYDKYRQMRDLGVSGAMQSWYFGNYPSLMTRAAGRLSFDPFPPDQQTFLYQLALPEWGPHAGTVVKAWMLFQEAYAQYPVYHVFGYYAPMHDGPVWPLYLQPVNKVLIANWKFMPEFPVHGDRIGECLQDAFTLDEALLLCARMSRTWQKGLQLLNPIEAFFLNDLERLRDINTARALGILFASGYHILLFYQLRERLAESTGPEAQACLEQMRRIAIRERDNSRKLADCCLVDPALGFNSEHEGYRFYPEVLENRAAHITVMLEQELPKLKQRIQQGLIPYPAYTGQEPDRPVYQMSLADSDWSAIQAEDLKTADGQSKVVFRACHDDAQIALAITCSGAARPIRVRFFPQRLWPERTYIFDPLTGRTTLEVRDRDRKAQIISELETDIFLTGTAGLPQSTDETTVQIRMPIEELQRPASSRYAPLRFNLLVGEKREGDLATADAHHLFGSQTMTWVRREPIAQRLAQSPVNPDEYGWLYFT